MIAVLPGTQLTNKRSNHEWLAALRAHGPARERALADLRDYLTRAVLVYLSRHRNEVQNLDRGDLMQLAHDCTTAVLYAIDEKLPTFRDDSRFTTWAYSHAVKHAAGTMRYRSRPPTSQTDR